MQLGDGVVPAVAAVALVRLQQVWPQGMAGQCPVQRLLDEDLVFLDQDAAVGKRGDVVVRAGVAIVPFARLPVDQYLFGSGRLIPSSAARCH